MFDLPLALFIPLLGALVLGLGWLRLDAACFAWLVLLRKKYPACTPYFRLLSWTPFSVSLLFAAPFLFWFVVGDTFEALALFLSCTLALALAFLGKFIVMRARPAGHVTYLGRRDSSFPSAHTAGPFAAAFILADVFTGGLWSLAVLGFAGLVALSRLWLQLHFLSDIAGGFLLAYAAAYFVTQSSLLSLFF